VAATLKKETHKMEPLIELALESTNGYFQLEIRLPRQNFISIFLGFGKSVPVGWSFL
jgi:hypothetical protein